MHDAPFLSSTSVAVLPCPLLSFPIREPLTTISTVLRPFWDSYQKPIRLQIAFIIIFFPFCLSMGSIGSTSSSLTLSPLVRGREDEWGEWARRHILSPGNHIPHSPCPLSPARELDARSIPRPLIDLPNTDLYGQTTLKPGRSPTIARRTRRPDTQGRIV